MHQYLIKTPAIIRKIFPKYIWRFSKKEKDIYLTFDDGPTPEITEFVLSELEKHQAKATFFCIGKNILEHPHILKKITAAGHSVGNHTQTHLKGWESKNRVYLENILLCEETILKAGIPKTKQKIFRPPYGKIKSAQARELIKKGYKIIMWNVLSADFDMAISPERCLENVTANVNNGSIIVFHDSIKASEKLKFALPKVLKKYAELGYTFRAI
jgi:peptidoglycan/xylan/chitin deacetylase (PgdA/CDA1 family)